MMMILHVHLPPIRSLYPFVYFIAVAALLVVANCRHHNLLCVTTDANSCSESWSSQKSLAGRVDGQRVLDDVPHVPHRSLTPDVLDKLLSALDTLQSAFFQVWLGIWPDAIDWTSAVMGAHVSAVLYTLTRATEYTLPQLGNVENTVNRFYSQIAAFYFGQNAFALRTQAYDDMLWVVLGWLEPVKLMRTHSDRHFPHPHSWHGTQYQAAFAHRANLFWELAADGWDTTLCGGGMVWSPYLEPYKNAITNQLYITASAAMYLHFPGDDNTSPFARGNDRSRQGDKGPYDKRYLDAAVTAYAWLNNSGMTNQQGLYTDGFHIKGWNHNGSIGTAKCDKRNEQVYTYNQGVILSGLRGLWEGIGHSQYLEDGHKLVDSVIRATGWVDGAHKPSYDWKGLGRNGILEDACDSWGDCDQDAQTFKGIFFTHLAHFCEPLPREPVASGMTHSASPALALLHTQACQKYTPWLKHNAYAALRTRDDNGVFGQWWGEPDCDWEFQIYGKSTSCTIGVAVDAKGNDGHRNWGGSAKWRPLACHGDSQSNCTPHYASRARIPQRAGPVPIYSAGSKDASTTKDSNDRGRGRTVESHSGGVAVLRALFELDSL
ncbi:Six-hairpin glycosidase [Pseudovirgaria hyperparasitica]|uniref:Six-hairpin glycosidase n=1 Tax=Pseudovirgaria hyperparasitica TaxID=470096 RepID=A0A6A6VZ93_9PEZI|nr:Six-hairpin glycosidase [Pseudovirgaria hyperparasitica]KAF2755010.1 Six-hairpin glycosidase [Pseudovirgaria hyperparasitica]